MRRVPFGVILLNVDALWTDQSSIDEEPAPDETPEARGPSHLRPVIASAVLHVILVLAILYFERTELPPSEAEPTLSVTLVTEEPQPVSETAATVAARPEPVRPPSHAARHRAERQPAERQPEHHVAEAATPSPVPVEKPPLNAHPAPLNPLPRPLLWPGFSMALAAAEPPPERRPPLSDPSPSRAAPPPSLAAASPPPPPPALRQPAALRDLPPPPSSPRPDNRALNDYSETVKRWIIRYRDAQGDFDGHVEGGVVVKCQIMPNGDVSALTVLQSSGSGAMDNYILNMFMRASPLPVPPKEYQSAPLDLTFRFDLHS